ncbi:Site-specific recombinase XerC [Dyadobacter koreensis]|uniref:Site-specific recombinase XerC n=1 Tax=Dyadobacter koreensis TaxID=408657 RepID=A0A1H7B4I8_9BACT|nr:site-specific integrase [Dyadobacter koreensis]SEJ71167.1 Site-specific recombinase XerC [Dyadobacter koreensis]
MFKDQFVKYKVVYDRKKQAIKKGKALVQIEAYQYGDRRYFSTGIYLTPAQWSQKNRNAKDLYLSSQIRSFITKLEKHEKEFRYYNDGHFTLAEFDSLKAQISDRLPAEKQPTFNEFFAAQIKARDKEFKWNTYRQQTACINLLNEFNPSISFGELKFKTIDGLHQFMVNKGHNNSTSQKRHKIIKGYIEKAIKLELLTVNPYNNFTIPKPVVNKMALLPSELRQIEELQFEPGQERLKKVRDMFLFSVYTGLRWGDVAELSANSFIDSGNELVLSIKASKTNKLFQLPLSLTFEGKGQEIAKRYIASANTSKLFKGIYNAFANKSLKTIGSLAGIKKSLHFHMARHTAATLMAQLVGVLVAQNILQHSKLSTTQDYLHLSDQDRNERLQNVKNWY